jgi:hypothetical protein
MEVLLSDQNCSGFSQPSYDFRIAHRHPVCQHSACRRGPHTGRVNQVFQSNRNAVQSPAPLPRDEFSLSVGRFSQRRIRGHRDERIQLRIERIDFLQTLTRQLDG